jgi:hypothetical protein
LTSSLRGRAALSPFKGGRAALAASIPWVTMFWIIASLTLLRSSTVVGFFRRSCLWCHGR